MFISYLALLQAPFRMLGFVLMMQQRGAPRPSASTRCSTRSSEISRRARTPSISSMPTARSTSKMRPLRPSTTGRRSSTASTCTVPAGRDRRPGRAHRLAASPRVAAPDPPLLRRDRRRRARRRPRRARPDARQLSAPHRHRARRAVPLLGVDPRQHRLRPARRHPRRGRSPRPPAAGAHDSSSARPTATTPWSASGATRCRAASASASPSPARSSTTRGSSSSTTPPAPSTCRSSSQIHGALRSAARRAHHAHHRPPALDHQPGRAGRAARGRQGRRRRHPPRADGHRAPLRRRSSPTSRSRATRRRPSGSSEEAHDLPHRHGRRALDAITAVRPVAWPRGMAAGVTVGCGAPEAWADGFGRRRPARRRPRRRPARSPACRRSWTDKVDERPRQRARPPRLRSSTFSQSRRTTAGRFDPAHVSSRQRKVAFAWFCSSSWRRSPARLGPTLTQLAIDKGMGLDQLGHRATPPIPRLPLRHRRPLFRPRSSCRSRSAISAPCWPGRLGEG